MGFGVVFTALSRIQGIQLTNISSRPQKRATWRFMVIVKQFASASCREASGTSRPGSGLLPPNPTLPPTPNFLTPAPPPPPPPCGTPPNPLEELQTDAVEGPACRWLLQGECLKNPHPPTPPHPTPAGPLPPLCPSSLFCETLFPPFLSWGRPGCRGGARKRLQL